MTPDAILALYAWHVGSCFRCAQSRLFVTYLGSVTTPSGDEYKLDACGACILNMESERQRWASRRGREYAPGSLGS